MQVNDKFTNLVANLAIGNAKSVNDRFRLHTLCSEQLNAMFRSDWLSKQIIELPVKDMLRPWRSWQADAELIEVIEAAERRHQVREKLKDALILSRLYGGSAIVIGANMAHPNQPLDVNKLGKGSLEYLAVLTRDEINAAEIDNDPTSPLFRLPKTYNINSKTGGGVTVHASRVIRFVGAPRYDFRTNPEGWGDSVLQAPYDAIHHFTLSSTGIAELIHEAKVDVIKVSDLGKRLQTEDGTNILSTRFQHANMLKSINNMLLLDKEDEWDRKQTNFSTLPEVMAAFKQTVAGAADIPATRLFGTSPKGMNATGESDLRNYYDMLDGQREDVLRPKLEVLDEILWRDAIGSVPEDAFFTFNPLWQKTDKEKAEIAKIKAETAEKYVNMGLISDEPLAKAIANALIEDGTFPGLEAALREHQEEGGELVFEEVPEAEALPPSGNPRQEQRSTDRFGRLKLLPSPTQDGMEQHAEHLRQAYRELDEKEDAAPGSVAVRAA